MDLTKQPPRRPSNAGFAGIVGLARMTDKARGHNAETIGLFKYGTDSGLDMEVLELVRMSAADFSEAVDTMDDDQLQTHVLEKARRSQEEIDAFNREHLEREPQDDLHRRLLEERLAKYAPDRTDIKTVFASIELDDWGDFRGLDLTQGPPRTPYLRSMFGLMCGARMADKARATKIGKLGDYKYGDDSGFDRTVLAFLELDAETFMEAAYANPNDIELSEWISERVQKIPPEICAFNAARAQHGRFGEARDRYVERRNEICPDRHDIDTFFDLIDYDDEKSFSLVDLTRHAPRSIYDTSLGGVAGLGRAIDKGRAYNTHTLGEYWYGDDSGFDRAVLAFLDTTADTFAGALKIHESDEGVLGWLGERLNGKDEQEVSAFNHSLWTTGPSNDHQWRFVRNAVGELDAGRQDICCFAAITTLDDKVSFARFKAGV